MSSNISLFNVGDRFQYRLVATSNVMTKYLEISGDSNPVHRDEQYATKHGFRGPIVYGNLLGAMVSRLVGMELPTPEVIILQQSLDFRKPVYVGEEVRLDAEVTAVYEAVQSVKLKLAFHSSSTEMICTGQCSIKCL